MKRISRLGIVVSLFFLSCLQGGSGSSFVSTPTFNPAAGAYDTDLTVELSTATEGAGIYYTIDGTDPTGRSTPYQGGIPLSGDETSLTIKAIATKPGMLKSPIATATYSISYVKAANPLFLPTAGTYETDQDVVLSSTTDGATIYFTIDGSTPTVSSTEYTGGVAVAGDGTTVTIKAIAVKSGRLESAVSAAAYEINYDQVSTPQFSPVEGTYETDQQVAISTSTVGATIYYTTDRSDPSAASTEYAAPVSVAGDGTNMTIKALAVKSMMIDSTVASANYSIVYPLPQDPPILSPVSSYFVDDLTVTISSQLAGATLFYTTNGSTPACAASGGSSSPVTLTLTEFPTELTTVKAISCKAGYEDSNVASAGYRVLNPDVRVGSWLASTIQEGIDVADEGDIVYIPPGNYDAAGGQILVNKRITLIGAGQWPDPASNTIIEDIAGADNVIRISAGGLPGNRLAIRNLRVTGGLGVGNIGTGIMFYGANSHIELDNIVSLNNGGNGVAFDANSGDQQDIHVRNSAFVGNGNHGFKTRDGDYQLEVVLDNCDFEENVGAGAMFYVEGNVSTNLTIANSSFFQNAEAWNSVGDIVFSGVNGNITISDVSIVSDNTEAGIRISGVGGSGGGYITAGTVALTDVQISGTQAAAGTYPSAGVVLTRYTDASTVTLNNVVIDSTAPVGLFLGTIVDTGPDLGDLSLEGTFAEDDIKLGKHGSQAGPYPLTSADINATGVNFEGATSDAEIEDRVYHYVDDNALGTVTWTSP